MWESLRNKEDIFAIVKNQTKEGDYYWVTTLFEIKYNPIAHAPEGYLAFGKAAPQHAINGIVPLYKDLLELEKKTASR